MPRLATAKPPENCTLAFVHVLPEMTKPPTVPFRRIGCVRSIAMQADPEMSVRVPTIGEGLPDVAHSVDQVEGLYTTAAVVCVTGVPDTVTFSGGEFTVPKNRIVPAGGVNPGSTVAGSTSLE